MVLSVQSQAETGDKNSNVECREVGSLLAAMLLNRFATCPYCHITNRMGNINFALSENLNLLYRLEINLSSISGEILVREPERMIITGDDLRNFIRKTVILLRASIDREMGFMDNNKKKKILMNRVGLHVFSNILNHAWASQTLDPPTVTKPCLLSLFNCFSQPMAHGWFQERTKTQSATSPEKSHKTLVDFSQTII
ncbi:hypothetical protein PPACK8108_LOCUS14461 [Phakopsora pachyrhizi]|uniref:Uncharacterized protein n=1 Tax=Phakopsora pachyrhizi TaxID=170000 RepID=A0AAV0B7A8_PHAPC|nr:hypothetical protein PPACK8108_LOCUS14461 [Phakopsora pachyrhizi]